MSTMKTVQLNIADRVLIVNLFSRLQKSDLDTARKIRGITDSTGFDLRTAERLADKAHAERESQYQKELDEYKKALETRTMSEAEPQPPKKIEALSWEELAGLEKPKTFTIDTSYITWLRDELEEMNWNEMRIQQQNGDFKTVQLPISIGQQITIANLDDALAQSKPLETRKDK